MSKKIRVAVAVISNPKGEILLTRRANDKHQGGLWEFPGGKCEPGEAVFDTLVREISEELDIKVTAAAPLISIPYQYPDLHVLLEVYRVTAFNGQPRGAEGQPMQWVSPEQLDSIALPAANRPIVRAIQLPELYLITPDLTCTDSLQQGTLAAAQRGIQLIQLRAPQLSREDYLQLADRLLAELSSAVAAQGANGVLLQPDNQPPTDLPGTATPQLVYGDQPPQASTARLMLKGELPDLLARPQAGWHLTSAQLHDLAGQERPLPQDRLLAASCHNAEELALAAKLGCDFATLSPVLTTATHPDAPTLGFEQARQLTAAAQLPVYWLGGLTTQELTQTKSGGAQGIAAIRGLWQE